MQQQRTISSSECDVWPNVHCIRWPVWQLVQWLDPEEAPQPYLHQKRSWSLSGGLLPIWSTTVFFESRQNQYIWEVCSPYRWDAPKTAVPAAGIGQQRGPNSSPQQCSITHCATNTSEIERIGLRSFVSSAIFTWLLANQLPLFQASWKLFAGKMLPTISRRQKMLFKCSSNPEAPIFML